ncbi:class I SAM-dependent methyltransferase [Bradyrhizobium sp. 2TAF24]|uniref:class I SAM-dependent methyltransferase n=1 Tax=Bradyrhizobium sp. 2TAF24 TaxID=3233011 RepID=UPI003F913A15
MASTDNPTASGVPGTQGYAALAAALVARWEQISSAEHHGAVMHLMPRAPADVLDIGAGSGRDAAWLAAMGHRVVAVEPLDAFRHAGMALHRAQPIDWRDDSLPDLATFSEDRSFDLVMLSAVWMHLAADERCRAMPRIAALLKTGGTLILSLRHGPVPDGRRMFVVSAEDTVALARAAGLRPRLALTTASTQPANRHAGVTWTRLAFARD